MMLLWNRQQEVKTLVFVIMETKKFNNPKNHRTVM